MHLFLTIGGTTNANRGKSTRRDGIAVVVSSTKTPTTTRLVATNCGTGGPLPQRTNICCKKGKSLPVEFYKGMPFHEGPVNVPLMLSKLHACGDLDRIRAEVNGIRKDSE
jgi:hypothetical protein